MSLKWDKSNYLKSKGQSHWERKNKNRLLRMSTSKVDRFLSN